MDIYGFIMPDEMVMQAVETACSFFDLPEAPVINSDGVCVRENNTSTTFDDVFGF